MFRISKKKAFTILVPALVISLIPIIGNLFSSNENVEHGNELYRNELTALNSLDKMCNATEESYSKAFRSTFDTIAYTELCSEIVKNRFTHGPLNYTFKENWIAALCGKIIWSHMSSIIISDDVLKHNYGLCSQQTIVFMDMLKRKKIKVRSVGLGVKEGPGHFLCEVAYNNKWHLYDVSKEPSWNKVSQKHYSLEYYLTDKNSFYKIYDDKLTMSVFEKLIKTFEYGDPEKQPGSRMILFHRFTKFIIYLIPLLCLTLLIFMRNKSDAQKEEENITSERNVTEVAEPLKQGA